MDNINNEYKRTTVKDLRKNLVENVLGLGINRDFIKNSWKWSVL